VSNDAVNSFFVSKKGPADLYAQTEFHILTLSAYIQIDHVLTDRIGPLKTDSIPPAVQIKHKDILKYSVDSYENYRTTLQSACD
jgi:hypothetical protein